MKNKRYFKIIILIIALVTICAVCLTACDNKGNETTANESYTITYYDGTQKLGSSKVEINDTDIELITPPTKQGYNFKGWYVDKDLKTPFVKSEYLENKRDISLYAKYDEIDVTEKEYTITFCVSNDQKYVVTVKEKDTDFLMPEDPVKENHIFKGWYVDKEFQQPFEKEEWLKNKSSIEVYAKFEVVAETVYTITFIADGATHATVSAKESDKYINMPSKPIKEGYTFVDWYLDDNFTTRFDSSKWINDKESITVHAKFNENLYTITFDARGGEVSPSSIIVKYTDTSIKLPTPTKNGYIFEGWYKDETFRDKFVSEDWLENKENITLYAKFLEEPKDYKEITLMVYGKNYGEVIKVYPNTESLNLPKNEIRDGYKIIEWYTDSELKTKFNEEEYLKNIQNIILYADAYLCDYNVENGVLKGVNNKPNVPYKAYIPNVYEGQNINTIYDKVFENDKNLIEVLLEKNISRIETGAFYKCVNLISINTDNVTYFGWESFAECKNLKDISLDNATYIDSRAFYKCESIQTLNIPGTVKEINQTSFLGCTSLNSLILNNGITRIWYNAFSNCTSLTKIDIPNSVVQIDEGAFSDCTLLDEINLPDHPANINSSAFSNVKALSNVNNIDKGVIYIDNYLVDTNASFKESNYEIKQGCISILPQAFFGKEILRNIIIPTSVLRIGDSAFYGTSILSLDIPDNTLYIASTIVDNTPLKSQSKNFVYAGNHLICAFDTYGKVTIKEGTISIAEKAFAYDENSRNNLSSIVLPSSLKRIGASAFYNRYSNGLESVEFSGEINIEYIGENAFYGNKNLHTMDLGSKIKIIDNYAFQNCLELDNIVLPNTLTKIGDGAFTNCNIHEIYIPNSVEYMGDSVFYHYKGRQTIVNCQASEKPIGWNDKWSFVYRDTSSSPSINVIVNWGK